MKPAIQRGKPINFTYTLVFDFKKLLLDKKKAREDENIITKSKVNHGSKFGTQAGADIHPCPFPL